MRQHQRRVRSVLFLLPAHVLHFLFFFFNDTATTEIYTLSLHDALPISRWGMRDAWCSGAHASRVTTSRPTPALRFSRSEEHTSELQSLAYLVCRLLLEKKKIKKKPEVTNNESN